MPKHWHKAKKIALCTAEGIYHESFIESFSRDGKDIVFQVEGWLTPLNEIKAEDYILMEPILVEEPIYNGAYTLPELLFSNNVQRQFLKMLRDVSDDVEIGLNSNKITRSTKISSFKVRKHLFHWRGNYLFYEHNGVIVEEIRLRNLEVYFAR